MAEQEAKTGGRKTAGARRGRGAKVEIAAAPAGARNSRRATVGAIDNELEQDTGGAVGAVSEPGMGLWDLLPAPEDLAKYEKVVPGGAERIIELAERQARHARRVESEQLASRVRSVRIRQAITFVLAGAAGLLGGALLLEGSELAGLIIILVDVVALVGVTIYGKNEAE